MPVKELTKRQELSASQTPSPITYPDLPARRRASRKTDRGRNTGKAPTLAAASCLLAPPAPNKSQAWQQRCLALQPWQDRWCGITLAASAAQQILLSSSSLWIQRAIKEVHQRANPTRSLCAFFLSQYLLPNLPRAYTQWAKSQWMARMQRRYTEAFIAAHYNQPLLWAKSELAEGRATLLATDMPVAVERAVTQITDGAGRIINFGITTLMISWLLSPSLMSAFAAGATIAYVSYRLTAERRELQAQQTQAALNALGSQRSSAWDNIVLGNARNAACWREREQAAFGSWQGSLSAQEQALGLMTLASNCLSSLPILAVLGYQIAGALRAQNYGALAGDYLPLLPRIAANLENGFNIIQMLPRITSALTALRETLSPCQDLAPLHIAPLISLPALTFKLQGVPQPAATWLAQLQRGVPGRYELAGATGAGKSLLCAHLKAHLGERAALLPPTHKLNFPSSCQGSAGQQINAAISQLLRTLPTEVDVVFLDEPRASLDAHYSALIEAQLAGYAQKLAIVEARRDS